MWTSIKNNRTYSAQITPYHGSVKVEIIYLSDAYRDIINKELWLTVMDKSFGSFFRSSPTEKNYKDATAWVEKQLELIEEYGTAIVKKPEFLSQMKEEI